ncbi:MAG: putative sulfate exporter family transporter [Elusimicrobia bacterium]|nr:putative sulfate exporter family transporter [Elusimicrobiota bacterium]
MEKLTQNRLFWLGGAVLLSAVSASPALALAAGAALALSMGNEARSFTAKSSKYFLQWAVVLLGFGLEIGAVLKVGRSSLWITCAGISFTLAAGFVLGRLLGISRDLSLLISGGTAICGGSAIAALSEAMEASQADTAMALAVVFLLNAVALTVFPQVGHAFGLSQSSFGMWAAMAIHDTSSVVGAAASYGQQALGIATTVKLTRALWILPVAFIFARSRGNNAPLAVPWFLFGFLVAAVAGSFFVQANPFWHMLSLCGRHAMSGALFLVGAGLTLHDLRRIGSRPLLKGIALWVVVSCASLAAVLHFHLGA